jgi:hypothetical protein
MPCVSPRIKSVIAAALSIKAARSGTLSRFRHLLRRYLDTHPTVFRATRPFYRRGTLPLDVPQLRRTLSKSSRAPMHCTSADIANAVLNTARTASANRNMTNPITNGANARIGPCKVPSNTSVGYIMMSVIEDLGFLLSAVVSFDREYRDSIHVRKLNGMALLHVS